jgi:hypothetical protein
MRFGTSLAWVAMVAMVPAALPACARDDPPAPHASPSVALPDFPPDGKATAGPSATPAAAATPVQPQAPDADSAVLPQTRDRPRADGPAFETRVNVLWSGIVQDDPERAMIFFFPLAAYQQVKDVANPTADWKHRLVAAFARDIHALHARLPPGCVAASPALAGHLEAGGSRCRLVNLEVPSSGASANPAANGTASLGNERNLNVRWVQPGEEYNKIGYYRAFGSRLRYEVDGAPRAFDVKSLISWRGEWYVVHLSAF